MNSKHVLDVIWRMYDEIKRSKQATVPINESEAVSCIMLYKQF